MVRLIKQSMLSGFLVGLGVVINTKSPNPFMGAMLFSLALLVIIECNLKLYTGKIGYVESTSIKDLMIMLAFNLFGIMIPVFVEYTLLDEQLLVVSIAKFSKDYLELFLDGFMCGTLMFVAVHCKKYIITIFSIMIFILSGYEHCIADFPYLLVNFNVENLFKYICIIIGNSIGSISINMLLKQKGEN